MSINSQAAIEAVHTHGTVFFDGNLQPVVPQPGQWFCEFDDGDCDEGQELRDEAFVKYVGPDESVCWDAQLNDFAPHGAPMLRHLVSPEHDDDARRPRGVVLILQH